MTEEERQDSAIEQFDAQRKELTRLMSYYRCAMMEIETKFRVLNEERASRWARNPIESIKCRLKTPESIIKKLLRRGFPVTVPSIEENLNDVAGVRVICSFIEDVYELSEVLLAQDDVLLVERKDYIANPKPNGYRSLHLIVRTPIFLFGGRREMKVEIQLRTIAMDFWATLEHELGYKKGFELSDDVRRELFACAEESAALDARMNALKNAVIGDRDEQDAPGDLKEIVEGILRSGRTA